MKYFYHTTLICLLLGSTALAQTVTPDAYWSAGSTGKDGIWDIAIDTAGNQYICGYFTGTVDIDPTPGVYNLTQPSGQSEPDAFLLALDAAGNFLWAKQFGGSLDGLREIRGIELDNNGNVYVFGNYTYNIQFEPNGPLWTTNSTNATIPNGAFVAKFSQSGMLQWGVGWYALSSARFFIFDLQIDQTGDVYIAGFFQGVMDFNPYSGSSNVIARTSSGDWDMALLKMSGSGAVEKVRVNGSVGEDGFSGIALSENNTLFVAGFFSNTIDMNWGTGVNNITSSSDVDLFVMKLDTALNFKWVKPFGGQDDEYLRDFKRKDSALVIYGVFYQNVDLDPSPTNAVMHTSNGDLDCFIQVLDTNGNYTWSRSYGGLGRDSGWRMHIDDAGNYSLCGVFSNSVDFDPSPTDTFIVTSVGNDDGYFVDFDYAGNFLYAAGFGSNAGPGAREYITGKISNSMVGDVVVGFFHNTIDINPNQTVTQTISSAGQEDMLYLKLVTCPDTIVQYTDSVCASSYLLPDGTTVYQSGYYLSVLPSSQGCDSTVGTNVVLNPIPSGSLAWQGDTAIVVTNPSVGSTYQWYDCNFNQPIPGATRSYYVPTANGRWAVELTKGPCTYKTPCFQLNNFGLVEKNILPNVELYPNPTNGLLSIQSSAPWQKVEVLDMLGRNLQTYGQHQPEIDLGHLPSGVYLVKVYFAEGVVVKRVVRE